MPWDPYFRYCFHLWQTFLYLRLRTFDFFKILASIFLLSARTACNFAPLCAWVKNYVGWNSASIIFHLLREAVVHPSFTTKICFSHIGIFALEVKDLRKLLYYSSGEISYPSARKKLGILFYKQRKKKKTATVPQKSHTSKEETRPRQTPLIKCDHQLKSSGIFS